MAQQVIYQNGQVLQWQDTEKLNYAERPAGAEVMLVTPEQWTQQDALRWVVGGALTDIEPVIEHPEPELHVPQSVTMRQARQALLLAGLLDDVDTAIATLPSPDRELAEIEWEYSQIVERHRPFVLLIGPALGLDDAALDDLFVKADKL